MNLFFHLFLHILTGILAGYVVWKLWKKTAASFAAGLAGAFFVDLDHILDYVLAFGWNFFASWRIGYFLKGYQFLKSDKIYVLLHGWEYVIILVVLAIWIFKNKTAKSAILALAIGLFFHLSIDSFTNEGAQFKTYSIIYRFKNNFKMEKLVTPEHFQDHQMRKNLIKFEY